MIVKVPCFFVILSSKNVYKYNSESKHICLRSLMQPSAQGNAVNCVSQRSLLRKPMQPYVFLFAILLFPASFPILIALQPVIAGLTGNLVPLFCLLFMPLSRLPVEPAMTGKGVAMT